MEFEVKNQKMELKLLKSQFKKDFLDLKKNQKKLNYLKINF